MCTCVNSNSLSRTGGDLTMFSTESSLFSFATIRDFMDSDMERTKHLISFLPALLSLADQEVEKFISKCVPTNLGVVIVHGCTACCGQCISEVCLSLLQLKL